MGHALQADPLLTLFKTNSLSGEQGRWSIVWLAFLTGVVCAHDDAWEYEINCFIICCLNACVAALNFFSTLNIRTRRLWNGTE